jgi:hypothetical protein
MQSPLGATIKDPKTGENAPRESFRFAEVLGNRVVEIALDSIKRAQPAAIDSIEFRKKTISIPIANKGFVMAMEAGVFGGRKKPNADGTDATEAGYVRLSGGGRAQLEIALIPGELYPELSVGGIQKYEGADYPDAPFEPAIKKMMSAPYRMLFGLANDEIGYIIPKVEWDEKEPWLQNAKRRHYGEVNSVGPETAPIITKAMDELIKAPAATSR